MICAVENCVRTGQIELDFPPDHAERSLRAIHATVICGYHAGMAVELFASRGLAAPINTDVRQRHIARDRTGRVQRYPVRKPHDNTEYDS